MGQSRFLVSAAVVLVGGALAVASSGPGFSGDAYLSARMGNAVQIRRILPGDATDRSALPTSVRGTR